jgi:DNA-directed RNA polymerase specialized sigma24 family protein
MPGFPETQWSVVILAAQAGEQASRGALGDLFRSYWYPLFAWLRANGKSRHEAEDLLQGFFVHLCERQTLARADRLKGSFRSFMLGSLRYYLANERDFAVAQKRGGGAVVVSMDIDGADARLASELPAPGSDQFDRAFDYRWAMAVMEHSFAELRASYQDRAELFEALKGQLTAAHDAPYTDVAARTGVSVAVVKTTVHRMRRQFREILRRHIAVTVSAPHEVDEELRYLIRILADG